ncbi:fimbrial biogenesis chaperone [Pantoea sp. SGAir0184]
MKALLASFVLTGVAIYSAQAFSGVTVGGTRLIYDAAKKESSIQVQNNETSPYLIQSWVETTTEQKDKTFVVTPPLFRLDGKQSNTLRVIHNGQALPQDRESLYWLNIKAIPSGTPDKGKNTLQLAVKTRLKLIYRPAPLKESSATQQAGKLTWQRNGNQVRVSNPTPYYMNFYSVSVDGKTVEHPGFVTRAESSVLPCLRVHGAVRLNGRC